MTLSKSRLEKVFFDKDADAKGYLTTREFKLAIIVVFGYKPSSREARRLIDPNSGLEGISLEAFISHCLELQRREDSSLEARRVFNSLDSAARGFLTVEDVRAVCRRVAPRIDAERIEAIVSAVDRNGHARIALGDFVDFYHMAKDLYEEEMVAS